jgi:hypothetical protein
MPIVSEYFDEHKEVFLRDNPGCNKSRLANECMRKFISWLQDQIFHSSDTQTSEYLKKLARSTLNNKIRKTHIKIVLYMLMLMMLWANTKTFIMVKYRRSASLTFTASRFLFSVATGLMESRVLYKTSIGSLALTLTVKDKSQSLSC